MTCEDLRKLFPIYVSTDYSRRSLTIKEADLQAKVKEVIWTNSDFQNIEQKIVKDMTSFFQLAGAEDIFHHDCDGIMIFEENGQKYMFLSELKSTFDSGDIYHAKDQIISSYLKINILLNLLPNYKTEDYIVKGFIFSYPPNPSYIYDLNRARNFPKKSKYKTESEFILDICHFGTSTKLTPLSCHKLKGLPLGDRGVFQEIEIYHIQVPKDDSSITLNVQDYI